MNTRKIILEAVHCEGEAEPACGSIQGSTVCPLPTNGFPCVKWD